MWPKYRPAAARARVSFFNAAAVAAVIVPAAASRSAPTSTRLGV